MAIFTATATVSLLFISAKAPLMMALLIVAQTLLVALSLYIFLSTSWLSFILVMILVSAMMVIFAYVSSLASNDFMVAPYSLAAPTLYFVPLLALTAYFTLTQQQPHAKSHFGLSDMALGPMSAYKLYAPYTSALTMFLIIYLLIALIVVAKISMSPKGALRASSM